MRTKLQAPVQLQKQNASDSKPYSILEIHSILKRIKVIIKIFKCVIVQLTVISFQAKSNCMF